MSEIRDENRWTDPKTGIMYKAVPETNLSDECFGCALRYARCRDSLADGRPMCGTRGVIWVRDDQPAMTAATDSAPDGTVQVQIGRPHILRLRPPVDARTLEHTLYDIRMERLIRRLPSDLTVTVEDGDIVVREAVQ